MISIIGDVYTVVEDHTKVGRGGCSMSRGGSGVRLARGKKERQPLTHPPTAPSVPHQLSEYCTFVPMFNSLQLLRDSYGSYK